MDFNESIFGPLHRKSHKDRQESRSTACYEGQVGSASTAVDFDESIFRPLKHKEWIKKKSTTCTKQPPSSVTSTNMECDESIFEPFGHKILQTRKNGRECITNQYSVQPKVILNSGINTLDVTQYNESILGPLLEAKKGGKSKDSEDIVSGEIRNKGKIRARDVGYQKKKPSTFEMMMTHLEESSSVQSIEAERNETESCFGATGDGYTNYMSQDTNYSMCNSY